MTFAAIRRLVLAAGLAAALPAAAVPAAAQTPSDARLAATQNRDARQDQRIAAGVAGGGINSNEAARLGAQQGRIDTAEARLASDGRYSRRDFARISARQNRASADIARARRNRR